jgi:hypothetical protein
MFHVFSINLVKVEKNYQREYQAEKASINEPKHRINPQSSGWPMYATV